MKIHDPINNREDFKVALESIASWQRFISTDEIVWKLAFGEDTTDLRIKMTECKSYIDSELLKWDLAKTEEERKDVVEKVEEPNITASL